jgi:hypothetical protein
MWIGMCQEPVSLRQTVGGDSQVPIDKIDDIYKYADRLNATLAMYGKSVITTG